MNTKPRSWLRSIPLAALLATLMVSPVLGQSVTASITGTVEDKSGAILKDASIVAVNQKTQVEYPTKSNDSGLYNLTGLPLGTYVVKAEAPGMKTLQTNAITLEVGQTARVALRLEVGAKAEEIEVIGVNPVLQTENATVGEVVTGSTVVALPLNGRNFAQLALLLPGVQTHSPDTFTTVKQSVDSGRPYVNGQREQSNNFMIDGLDANEAVDNAIAYYPSPDAIAEMKIETNNYSAEFGNVAGGIISTVLKSGTNEFHGSAFEFARNHKFDANTYGNKRSGANKTDFKQNIFGATLSGPLVKNRLFFFGDYQGQADDNPGDAVATVIPGNLRNASDPVVARILADTANYPLPTNGNATGNYVHFANSVTRNHQGDVKLDANLGPKDNMFLRGSYGTYDTHPETPVFPLAFGQQFTSTADSAAFNWNHAFSSSTVNEVRIGYSHVENNDEPADPAGVGNYAEKVGLPIPQVIPGLPALSPDASGLYSLGNAGNGHDGIGNTYQLSEKLSMSMGRHYVSFGGQFIHYNMNQIYTSNSGFLGSIRFNTLSDFLAGNTSGKTALVGQNGVGTIQPWTQLQNRIGLFVQDDWKPSSDLTVNLGVRWEYASPITEKDNHQVNFDYNTGAQILPGGAFGNALYDAYYGGVSPRLGFAWTANPKTVVRGGFGMVQYQEGTGANCRLTMNPPYSIEVTRNVPSTFDIGYADLGTAASQSLTNVQVRAWQTDIKPQLTKQWNVFVERQLSEATSLNVGYVGSRATHVVTFNDGNFNVDGFGSPRRLPNLGILRYTASNGSINYDGLQASLRHRMTHGLEFLASYTFSNALADNQGFYGPGWGARSANQDTAGIRGDGNYNPYDLHLDYGPEWFSSKHSASVSLNYQLPIGKGRSVGSDWSGVTQALLGGWNVSGILQVRSGLPVTVVNGWGEFGFTRPDLVPGADAKATSPTRDGWLNAAAFVNNAGNFGNSPVGVTRGPGYWNLDAGLDKNFDLGGSRAISLRVEAFNVFNHTNLGLPDRTLGGFNADGTPGNSNFGKITETANGQRVLELAAKFVF